MSDKVYVRMCERYTQWRASTPIEVDVEKLRKCDPPYEGNSHEELLQYLSDEVWNNYNWYVTNEEIYGETTYDLIMEDVDLEVYSDTRLKYAQEWLDVGVPNDEWRRTGGFEVFETNVDES